MVRKKKDRPEALSYVAQASSLCFIEAAECLTFYDRVGRALRHTADGAHVRAVVAEVGVDHVGFFRGVGADGVARAYRAAGVAHDAEVGLDQIHNSSLVEVNLL